MRVDEMTRTPVSVLRPARMDGEEGECIVLIYSRGQNAMDLELIASEGESAWSTTSRWHFPRRLAQKKEVKSLIILQSKKQDWTISRHAIARCLPTRGTESSKQAYLSMNRALHFFQNLRASRLALQ